MAADGLAIGLDIGGTKVLGSVVDVGTGAVVHDTRVATPSGSEALVEALAGVVEHLRDGVGGPVGAVGVGIAGLVGVDGVLRYSPNLPGIIDLPLESMLAGRIGCAVVIDNDATTATIAEHRLGAARGVDDVVYVALGTGIGGGLILDGRIRRGANGFGGEFGHMVVDPRGPVCACGHSGCWERVASGSALGELARSRARHEIAPAILAAAGGIANQVTGEHAVEAASAGDDAALAVLDAYGEAVALGISALVTALDPALVVIGGGVVDAGDLVMDPIRSAVARRVLGGTHRPEVPVVPAAFGGRSAAIGAAVMAADQAG